ncbi:MAG TPA: cytochrome b/b6 domain-containing protein, partial [Candidimonas sp.]|nr:cytochrome b/b6 domain-containing protein [Candidimonas sp.]
MMSTDTFTVEKAAQYSAFAIFLHWAMAILILGTIVLGWYMTSISDDPGSEWYFNLHKSIGIIIALLVLVRLAWRFGNTPAALPDTVPRWQAKASRAVHWMLYVCIVLMPILGLTGALFSRSGVIFFGLTVP